MIDMLGSLSSISVVKGRTKANSLIAQDVNIWSRFAPLALTQHYSKFGPLNKLHLIAIILLYTVV